MFKRVAVCTTALVFGVAGAASAATVHVETTGADSATCGAAATPCLTIAQAAANAASGDTVQIGEGTFPTGQVLVNSKSLEFAGAGRDVTVIDGGDVTTLPADGVFRFTAPGSSQVVRDLTIVNPGRRPTGALRFAISQNLPPGSPAGTIGSVSLRVSDVRLVGEGAGDLPINLNRNNGTVVVERSAFENVGGQAGMLAEQQLGPLTVVDSTFQTVGSAPGLQVTTHSLVINGDGAGPYLVRGNTFTGINGLNIQAPLAATTTQDASFTGPFDVEGNTFLTTGTGVSVSTTGNYAPGGVPSSDGTGSVDDLAITGNLFLGSGTGEAVRLRGQIPGAEVRGNVIRNWAFGVYLQPRANAPVVHPQGTVVSGNQIVGNGTGIASDVAVDAAGNWWGCNAGPGGTGCDTTSGAGTVTTAPHAVIGISSPVASLGEDGSAPVVVDLSRNSDGSAATAFPDGTLVTMSASAGSVADPVVSSAGGAASTTFTSSAATGRSASATLDAQTVTVTWGDIGPVPDVSVSAAQIPGTATASVTFTVDTPETVTSVTCSVDGASAEPCSSPWTTAALAHGSHTVTVTATTPTNSGSGQATFPIDAAAPETTITSGPTGTIYDPAATFGFTSSEAGSTFQCRLDGGAWASCTSPKTFSGLTPGAHTVAVRATDQMGNTDATPATRSFTYQKCSLVRVSLGLLGFTQITVCI